MLLPVMFRIILLSCCREEVENVSVNQRPGCPCLLSDRPEKQTLCIGCGFQSSFIEFAMFIIRICRKNVKMFQPIRHEGGHYGFPICLKITNLTEEIEIWLPVKLRCIP